MEMGIADRACVVTGASSGIGLATARLLSREGARLLLVGRNSDRLTQAASSCLKVSPAGESDSVRTLAMDVTDASAAQRAIDSCLESFGSLDVLVNNAGSTRTQPLATIPDDYWLLQWEQHVLSPMRFMRAIAPLMAEAGWGRIVNVSSAAGKTPSHRDAAYTVAKSAELALSRLFAEEYAKRGVIVNAVTPGPIETSLWSSAGGLADQVAAATGTSSTEAISAMEAGLPLGRFGTAEEVAAAIVFLCSAHSANVVGAAWSVDGGLAASYT